MVVYADIYFLVNLAVNYLILRLVAMVIGAPFTRWRLGIAAALGGGYAVAALVYPTGGVAGQLLCCGALVAIAYGGGGRFIQKVLLFGVLSFTLGGAVEVLARLGGNGRPVTLAVLPALLCLAVWLLNAALHRTGEHQQKGELVALEVVVGDRVISCQALVDTGNTLHSPMDNSPVAVIEWRLLRRACPELEERAVSAPAEALYRLRRISPELGWQLLPYRTVGRSQGLLLALRPGEIRVNGRRWPGRLVALSPSTVSDGGGYQALIGSVELAKRSREAVR